MSRYLTLEEKVTILYWWELAKLRKLPERQDIGGRGYPDPEIFSLCDRLNEISGVCTLQSCAGHDAEHSDGGIYPANLWIKLSDSMAEMFEIKVSRFQRYMHPWVARVGKHWQPDGEEIVEITFVRHDHPSFMTVCNALVEFFKDMERIHHGRQRLAGYHDHPTASKGRTDDSSYS